MLLPHEHIVALACDVDDVDAGSEVRPFPAADALRFECAVG